MVPTDHQEGEINLGAWVSSVRGTYRKGNLDSQIINRFGSYPGWTWDPIKYQFENNFKALERFINREGNIKISRRYKENGLNIGYWMDRIRKYYRNNQLDPELIERFEALPGWTWNSK